MSSRSRNWSSWAAAAAVLAVLLPAPARAAPADTPLPVSGVLTAGSESAVVLDLSDVPATGDRSATVTAGGDPEPATLEPVLSGDATVVLVVDTSADGAETVPAWLSAAARFVLEAPALTRSVVVTAGAPATVAGPPATGPLETVRTMDGLTASGERDTATALTLAVGQFPDVPPGRRVVMLYTSAPDAGGESAAALGERLRASGTMLVVAGTAESDAYWSAATAATGGFFAPAGDPVVVPALDQVQTALRARYLVRFPTPAELPATASITVTSGGQTFTGGAEIPGATTPVESGGVPILIWVLAGVGVVALALAVTIVILRRLRPPPPLPDLDEPPADDSVARGRATVAGSGPDRARGRASVTPPESENA